MRDDWQPLAELFAGLEAHPHVQRIGLQVERDDPWQLAWALLQILPLDEAFKAHLLASDDIDAVMDELGAVLGDLSGEEP